MIKLLLAILLSVTIMPDARAMRIRSVSSPVTMHVEDDGAIKTLQLAGQPLNYCQKSDFPEWAAGNLVGKNVAVQQSQIYIEIGRQSVLLNELLVRNGYLYDPNLTDAQEASAAERRGEWACSVKDAIFQLVLANPSQAKVVAAIALNESKFKGYPWPWTINVQGKSMYFESREEAYHHIMGLIKAGISSIDIGLTQVNWKYHSEHFKSPWDALQPSKNIQVCNTILTALHARLGDWGKTIKCYHNCVDPVRGTKYLESFARQYDEIANLKR